MKRILTLLVSAAIAHTVQAGVYTSTATVNTVIPDGDFSGIQSTINLGPMPGFITDINVILNVAGGFNGDFYAYLYHNGASAILLNRVGVSSASSVGYPDAGFGQTSGGVAFKLDDQAPLDVHSYRAGSFTLNGAGQLTGTWQSDGRNINPLSAGSSFDSASRSGMLSLFNGMDPNGSWSLYIADMSSGGEGTLASWGLEITAVPEPGVFSLALIAMASAYYRRLKPSYRPASTGLN